MFDGLLKSKFYSKCKSDTKLTRTRIEIIKRKRNAMQKYLRNDVADLLKSGLDINAYGRAEGLLVEQRRTSCYELIDEYCANISNNVSALDKQRECPEECREAASSLMFAAARFADLPELRDLRKIFSERYGNSLDSFVNKEFAGKLTSGLPSKEMKIQLLQDIALESGLEWDSKALENKLFNQKDYTEEINDTARKPLRGDMDNSVRKTNFRAMDYGLKNVGDLIPPRKTSGYSYYEQKEATEIEEIKPEAVPPPVKDIPVDTVKRTTEKINDRAHIRNVPKEEEIEEKPALKYRSIPPPYTKPEVDKTKSSLRDKAEGDLRGEKVEPVDQDDPTRKPKAIPKSVRRNLKPQPTPETSSTSDGDEEEKLNETKNNEKAAALGRRILRFFDRGNDQRDEEETMMDKLLQYYSRKKGPRERGKPGPVVEPTPTSPTNRRSREAPNRASSLPPPEVTTSPTETPKGHTRSASFQPELLTGKSHVHPKMPDYDEFLARLAAFRGK